MDNTQYPTSKIGQLLDIKDFERGEHRVKVEKQRFNDQDSMIWRDVANFPFWKE